MSRKYFGTDGIRGVANEELTALLAYTIGVSLGKMKDSPDFKVAIGGDTRLSTDLFKTALTAGLLQQGIDVYDVGVMSTPGIIRYGESDFAYTVCITASHNPYYDNGIKIIERGGKKLSKEKEKFIEDYIDKHETLRSLAEGPRITGRVFHRHQVAINEYLSFLENYIDFDLLKTLDITFDCANGATSEVINRLVQDHNFSAKVINSSPNGKNINDHCGSTCIKEQIEKKDFGKFFISYDGDGDRVQILTDDGVLFDGDRIIYFLARVMQEKEELHNNGVALTKMSNKGIIEALKKHGITSYISNVGDSNVQKNILEYGLSLGGEESGHIIYRPALLTGDGVLVSFIFLMSYLLYASLFKEAKEVKLFPRDYFVKRFNNQKGSETYFNLKDLSTYEQKRNEVLGSKGRLFIRMSGTEPVIRFLIEGENQKIVEEENNLLNHLLED
jgi:phosphoglucosamine mutase